MATVDPPKQPAPSRKRSWQERLKDVQDSAARLSEEISKVVPPETPVATIPLATIDATERQLVVVSDPEIDDLTVTMQVAVDTGATNVLNTTVSTSATAMNNAVWRWWVRERERGETGWKVVNSVHDEVWNHWNTASTTNACTQHRFVWNDWNDKHERMRETRAQREARQAEDKFRAEQAEIARKARVAEIENAKEKAYKLLLSSLDDKQKTELKDKGFFHCKSRKGVVYRIYKGTHGNVKRLDDKGKEIEKLCIQPDNVPDFDAMLAQKLHIEYNEDDFRKTANITRLMN